MPLIYTKCSCSCSCSFRYSVSYGITCQALSAPCHALHPAGGTVWQTQVEEIKTVLMNHAFTGRASNQSNTLCCHWTALLTHLFISLSICNSPSASIVLLPPLVLSLCRQCYRLHLCFHYTALFPMPALKLCLAVCHQWALLRQRESTGWSSAPLVVSLSCKGKLVDLGNSWQPSQILNIKIPQVELEINTNR